jgi:O-antigen/teichoic acid export membrane protein
VRRLGPPRVLPIPIEAALLGALLNTTPPTPPAPRFWQNNAPLRSSAVTITFQVVRYGVNIGVTMLLARLLLPADFGLFAIGYTFIGLMVLFKDAGMGPALLSQQNMTAAEWSALASLNCLQGVLLAGLCAALGPVLAFCYGEPRLAPALLLAATAFLFYGLDVQPNAQLLCAHRFRTHALIEFAAVLVAFGVSALLAWQGAGYWALFATEPIIAAGFLLGHVWAVRWRPRFSLQWREIRRFVGFGRDVTVTRLLGYGAQNTDNLILGIASGATALGYYNKAFRLIGTPQESISGAISRMATPMLAQLRDRPAEFVRAFRHFTLTSAALGLPGVAFLLVSTPEIVAVVYGPQWTPVIPLLRLLGLMGLANIFLAGPGWVYVATATVHRQVRWETLNLALLATAFLAGASWGATGVAIAASLVHGGLRVPALVYCFRGTPLRLRDVGAVAWRPLLATAVGVGAVLLAHALAGTAGPALATMTRDGLLLAAGYAVGWVAVPGWRHFLRHELRRPEPPAAPATSQ